MKTKRKSLKKVVSWTFVAVASAAAMSSVLLLLPGRIQAAGYSEQKCLNSSGASSVASVQYACSACAASSTGTARGTLWFNGDEGNKNSNVINVTDPTAQTVDFYLWGQVYSCGKKNKSVNSATHIWFGRPNEDKTSQFNNKVDFILTNNDGTSSFSRGVGQGVAETWYIPTNNSLRLKMSVPLFKTYAERYGSVNIDAQAGKATYKADVSVNRCFNDPYGSYQNPSPAGAKVSGACYGDNSTIELVIPLIGNDAEFRSWSYASADGLSAFNTFEKGPDSEAEREVSTDADTIMVNFDHQLSYVHPAAPTKYDPVKSQWGVVSAYWDTEVTIDGEPAGYNFSGAYTPETSGPKAQDDWSPNNLGRVNVPVSIQPGETKKVCSTITYRKKSIVWKESLVWSWQYNEYVTSYEVDEEKSGGEAWSRVCVVVKREVPAITSGDYTTTTTVQIKQQGSDIKQTHTLTSDEDGHDNNIVISTDDAHVDVDFWHNILWHGDVCPPAYHRSKMCDDTANTDYIITDESGASKEEGHHVGGDAEHGRTVPSVGVDLDKGETKKVCRRITIYSSTVTFQSYPVWHQVTRWSGHIDTHWYISYQGGTTYSEACATITRPADPFTPINPDPNDPGSPKGPTEGASNANLLYAGEQSSIGWQASAITYDTRRLMEWQAIVFQVPVYINGNNGNVKVTNGNISPQENQPKYTDTPCQWFDRALDYRNGRCDIARSSGSDGEKMGSSGKHRYAWADGQYTNSSAGMSGNQTKFSTPFKIDEFSETIVSPSLVGDKHCNSFGFQMQYYYAYIKNGSATWYKDTNNAPYWKTYDAACLTVAKKPSVATWNGGLSIGSGSVTTSISNRYDNSEVGINVFSNGSPIAFGSWSEYLAAINGGVDGFASGAALASGLSGPFSLTKASSPLTIANTPSIGSSGITTNNILRDRISQYFLGDNSGLQQRGASLQNIGSTLAGGEYSGTTILHANGNLRIEGNVRTNKNVNTIYNLPQVIIYAEGDIDIASNVTQIDAWVIAGGKINTCAEFAENVTEASVRGWSEGTTCSRNLKINGPVFADKVEFKRSYGSDGYSNNDRDLVEATNRAATGEEINLSADSYLWAYAQGGRYNSSYTEAYSRELPPRY